MNEAALVEQLKGHDAVISAFSGHAQTDIYGYYMKGIKFIITATKLAGVPRLLVEGGAGSLEVAPGVLVINTPDFPEKWKATAQGALDALELLKTGTEAGLDRVVSSGDYRARHPQRQVPPGYRPIGG